MTPSLRKYHRVLWFFLVAFLPAFFVATILVIPQQPSNTALETQQENALPHITKSGKDENLRLAIRRDSLGRQYQLEVELIRPFRSASTLVFFAGEPILKPKKELLLGQVSGRGIYRFELADPVQATYSMVCFFDPIKKQVLSTLKLQ